MGINRFSFEDKSRNWKLEMTDFQQLTLLVGASGVGKTQILKAIDKLRSMAKGVNYGGIHWYVDFTTIEKNNYIWEGAFEKYALPQISYENITLNGNILCRRTREKTIFNGKETVKLPKSSSLVHVLAEEEAISGFHKALNQININYNLNSNQRVVPIADPSELLTTLDNLSNIANADLNIITKLFLISKNDKTIFNKIKVRFCDIFPQVEDIKIELIKDAYISKLQSELHYNTSINIKEKNISNWIDEPNISSGMWQSLILISELYLSPEGGVFLIDEFENSLGINCLDELVSDILRSKRNLQFILTSHHPYIINNINFNHWKVVTRNGGVVKTHDAAHFHLGKSKHTAFMQLIQLEAYQTGSETAL